MILRLLSQGPQVLGGVADGAEGLALAEIASERASVLHIARDAGRMDIARQALGFFAPEVEVHTFPAWDCMPYDRVSPSATVLAERTETLSHLAVAPSGPRVVLTTVNAAVQRIPPRAALLEARFTARTGDALDMDERLVRSADTTRLVHLVERGAFDCLCVCGLFQFHVAETISSLAVDLGRGGAVGGGFANVSAWRRDWIGE